MEKVIDIKEWTENVYKPMREFDIVIGRELFGYEFLGWAYCPEAGLVYNPENYDWDPPLDPVYLRECECKKFEKIVQVEEKFFGHFGHCMCVIPRYSSSIRSAWLIIDRLLSDGYDIELKHEFIKCNNKVQWSLKLSNKKNQMGSFGVDDSVEKVICKVALLEYNSERYNKLFWKQKLGD